MTPLHALILGIVEGISEFLPISSTAHLILASYLLKLQQTDFLKTFEVVIQLGAILSVVVVYWKSLLVRKDVMMRIIIAFIPTAIIGFVLEKVIRNVLFESMQTILWSLFIGGIILIAFEKMHKDKPSDVHDMAKMSYVQAFLVGLFQALAVIPGVSRSGATIVGGMSLGLSRKAIIDFSFVLAVPTMLAATLLEIVKHRDEMSFDQSGLLAIGFVVSFIIALGVIKWLLGYIKKHTFVAFGVYRIVIAVAFFLFLLSANKTYTNSQIQLSLHYPSSWEVARMPRADSEYNQDVLSGSEGAIEIVWGDGLGGACGENGQEKLLEKMQIGNKQMDVCHTNENGRETWRLISWMPSAATGASVNVYTNLPDPDGAHAAEMKQILSSFTFAQ